MEHFGKKREGWVNIPRYIEDEHCRWKMPPLQVKFEGRGGSTKTIFTNLKEVAEQLQRPAHHILRYFGYEFGSKVEHLQEGSNDKFYIKGNKDLQSLENALDTFIDKYVLCNLCKYPDCVLMLISSDNNGRGSGNGEPRLELHSRCCPSIKKVDILHKLSTFIVNDMIKNKIHFIGSKEENKRGVLLSEQQQRRSNSSNDSAAELEEKIFIAEANKLAKNGNVEDDDDDDDEDESDWSVDTSSQAMEKRRLQLLGISPSSSASNNANSLVAPSSSSFPTSNNVTTTTSQQEQKETTTTDNVQVDAATKLISELNSFLLQQLSTNNKKMSSSTSSLTSEVTSIIKKHTGTDPKQTKICQILFDVLFGQESNTSDLTKTKLMLPKFKLLGYFVNEVKVAEQAILFSMEKVMTRSDTNSKLLIPKASIILNSMYDSGLISEGTLLSWHSHSPKLKQGGSSTTAADSKLFLEGAKQIRTAANKFIDWLKNAEDDDDDDE